MGLDEIGMTVTSTRHFFSGLCGFATGGRAYRGPGICLPWVWVFLVVGLVRAVDYFVFCFLVLSFA